MEQGQDTQYHSGSQRPLESLQGGMREIHEQQPMSGTNDSNSNQHDAPVAQPWSATTLGPKGPRTGNNDSAEAH